MSGVHFAARKGSTTPVGDFLVTPRKMTGAIAVAVSTLYLRWRIGSASAGRSGLAAIERGLDNRRPD
jgi:hypothetical protein